MSKITTEYYNDGNGIVVKYDNEMIVIEALYDSGFLVEDTIRMPILEFISALGIPISVLEEAANSRFNKITDLVTVLRVADDLAQVLLTKDITNKQQLETALLEAVLRARTSRAWIDMV